MNLLFIELHTHHEPLSSVPNRFFGCGRWEARRLDQAADPMVSHYLRHKQTVWVDADRGW